MEKFKCKHCIYFGQRHTTGHGESMCNCHLLESFMRLVDCYLPDNVWCSYKDMLDGYKLDEEEECILFKKGIVEIKEI